MRLNLSVRLIRLLASSLRAHYKCSILVAQDDFAQIHKTVSHLFDLCCVPTHSGRIYLNQLNVCYFGLVKESVCPSFISAHVVPKPYYSSFPQKDWAVTGCFTEKRSHHLVFLTAQWKNFGSHFCLRTGNFVQTLFVLKTFESYLLTFSTNAAWDALLLRPGPFPSGLLSPIVPTRHFSSLKGKKSGEFCFIK